MTTTKPQMPLIHAYTISGNLEETMKFALTHFANRTGNKPAAVWLHPDRIPANWPPEWPKVFGNDKLNRNIVGIEFTATTAATMDEPAQLRLI